MPSRASRKGFKAHVELELDGGFHHLLTVLPPNGTRTFRSAGAARLRLEHVLRSLQMSAKGRVVKASDYTPVDEVEPS